MSPSYVTLFDVAAQPYRWGGAGEGLVALALLVLGAVLVRVLRRQRLGGAVAAGAATALAAGVLLLQSGAHWHEHEACAEALRAGQGQVLEGEVTDLHPLRSPWQRPAEERFTVAGQVVAVPLLAQGCGYRRPVADPFREGARVRLRVWNGQLLKVEMAAAQR